MTVMHRPGHHDSRPDEKANGDEGPPSAPTGAIVNTCGSRFLGGCLGGAVDGVSVGSLDELAGLEAGSGPYESDELGCVDRAPAGLRGLDEFECHGQPGGS